MTFDKDGDNYRSYKDLHHKRRTQLLYGSDEAVAKGAEFMKNVESRMDITFDHRAPSIVIKIPTYYNGYRDILKRGGKIRCITEITKENIAYCRDLLSIVSELRHLEGLKGGIAINEVEYMATTVLQEAQPLTEVIYSNVTEVVAQGQYMFDTLWKNSISADKKMKEIEEGIIPSETKLITESNTISIKYEIEKFLTDSHEINIYASTNCLKYIQRYLAKTIHQIIDLQSNGKHKGINILTKIDRENIDLVRHFMRLKICLKNSKNFSPIDFIITDTDILVFMKRAKNSINIESLLYSNEQSYLYHFKGMFTHLWELSTDPYKSIKSIEESNPSFIETIENPEESLILIKSLISSAQFEILGIIPAFTSFINQTTISMLQHIKKISLSNNSISIKLLIAEEIHEEKLREVLELLNKNGCNIESSGETNRPSKLFKFKNSDNFKMKIINSKLRTEIGLVIVDRSKSVIVETKNDQFSSTPISIGLSSYSNSKQISLSYASIFESLWNQSELTDGLKIHDTLQQEFIHTAAHELKTPVQALLGYSDLLLNKTGKIEYYSSFIEKINKNTKRLAKLIDKVLDVTQIENDIITLKKENFNLEFIITELVKEYQNQIMKIRENQLSIQYLQSVDENFEPKNKEYGLIYADKFRITQVLMNLIENAISFTLQGKITITMKKIGIGNQIIIIIDDTGNGIQPEILPRLFTKFVTSSQKGTGLGLYICKKIVEAHGGKIWAENRYNNNQINGSRFSMILPCTT